MNSIILNKLFALIITTSMLFELWTKFRIAQIENIFHSNGLVFKRGGECYLKNADKHEVNFLLKAFLFWNS